MKISVLLWDNDPLQAEYLVYLYQNAGIRVTWLAGYRAVYKHLKQTPVPQVLVFNSQVLHKQPEQLKRLLKLSPTLAAMALVLRQDLQARLDMLALGAVVSLQQPVNDQELLAQTCALSAYQQRFPRPSPVMDVPQSGPLQLLPENSSVRIGAAHIFLKPQAFRLLAYFCQYPNRLHTREQLHAHFWGTDKKPSRHVDNLILYLRQQLPDHEAYGFESIYGQGYIFHLRDH